MQRSGPTGPISHRLQLTWVRDNLPLWLHHPVHPSPHHPGVLTPRQPDGAAPQDASSLGSRVSPAWPPKGAGAGDSSGSQQARQEGDGRRRHWSLQRKASCPGAGREGPGPPAVDSPSTPSRVSGDASQEARRRQGRR